jgi:hypothetical protein
MSENPMTEASRAGVPAPPPDSENEAVIDAEMTFRITVISSLLFCLAALFIILGTRMG